MRWAGHAACRKQITCVQYVRKKFLTYEINWDMYTWESIVLKLVLNKQGRREWIRFMCQERAQ